MDSVTTDDPRRVIVGVDGSPNSLDALEWAHVAFGRDAHLHVVRAGGVPDSLDDDSRDVLARVNPDRIHATDDDASSALVDFAGNFGAEAIVIGAHGHTHLPGSVGGTTLRTLRLAPCPVIVVGSHDDTAKDAANDAASGSALVVVGVGDGQATEAAIEWSAQWAYRTHSAVHLVRAVDPTPIFGVDNPFDVFASYVDPGQLLQWATDELDRRAGTLEQRGIIVTSTAEFGPAHRLLVENSGSASLLVIGKHYDGPITGFLMSRTLHAALLRAGCPVVVVPGDAVPDR